MKALLLAGPPEPLERARGDHKPRDTPRNKDNKRRIGLLYRSAHPGPLAFPPGTPVRLHAVFAFERPASHYVGRKKGAELRPDAPQAHTQPPDGSNLLKLLEDALNDVAWHDDAQIDRITIAKTWTTGKPYTRLALS